MKQTLTAILCFFSAFFGILNAQTAISDDFNSATISTGWWNGSAQYSLSQQNGVLKVSVNKNLGWATFGYTIPVSINLTSNPFVNLKVKSDKDITLDIYLVDENNVNKRVRNRISKSDNFANLCWDFSGITGIDFTKIKKIYIGVNGSSLVYKGKLELEDLKVGTDALKMSSFSGVENQTVYKNSKNNVFYVQSIANAHSFSFEGTSALVENVNFSPIINGVMKVSFDAKSNATGIETLTLKSEGINGYAPSVYDIKFTVEDNLAPTFTVLPVVKCKVGVVNSVAINDITDGNVSAKQHLNFSLTSENNNIIGENEQFEYVQDASFAVLKFQPISAGEAKATITVDDGSGTNSSTSKTIQIVAYEQWNNPPKIDKVKPVVVYNNKGQQSITLTGISDGDANNQLLTFEAKSSDESILPHPIVEYSTGNTALLKYTPLTDKAGNVNISIKVTDNGGNATNNGHQSDSISFPVNIQLPPMTGFIMPFSNITNDTINKIWNIEGNKVTQNITYEKDNDEDILHIAFKDKSTYTGIWYKFLNQKLDLSQNPYITMWVKSDINILFHLYYYDYKNDRSNVTSTEDFTIPANTWTKVSYDAFGKMKTAAGAPIAVDKIDQILFNYHPDYKWPFTNVSGNVWFKDVRIGDKADGTFSHPKECTIDDVAAITSYAGAGTGSIALSGISDGGGNSATVTATTNKSNIVTNLSVSEVVNGKATLNYTIGDATGTAAVTLTVSADGSANMVKTFNVISVAATPSVTSNINIDLTKRHQTMHGIGTFVRDDMKPYINHYVDDFGGTVARIGVIGNQLEADNDNNDPYVLDRSKLNYKAFDWEFYKELKAKGVEKFILTIWSVPAWMKVNATEDYYMASAPGSWENTDNKVDTLFYDEYAEYATTLIKIFKEKTGIDIYALSLQNEPAFCEPYASAILSPAMYIKLINNVGKRFKDEGVDCKLYMAEQVLKQPVFDWTEYLNTMKSDPTAWQYSDIQAVHGYEGNGITNYTADSAAWVANRSVVQNLPHPFDFWMTETEMASVTWANVLSNVGAMSTAFVHGDISWWTQWDYVEHFTVLGKSNQLAYAQAQFAKFVKPGAVRVDAITYDKNLLVSSFVNTAQYGKNLATVVINKGTTPISIKLTGLNIPSSFDVYQTYNLQNFKKIVGGAQKDVAFVLPAQSITTFVAPLPNAAPTIDPVKDQVIIQNLGEQSVLLTGITDGGEGNQTLTVTPSVATGATLVENVRIEYFSPDNTAKLYFTPKAGSMGNVKIKINVNDNQPVNNITSTSCNIIINKATAINEIEETYIKLYPNPACGYLNLQITDKNLKAYSIINLMGEVINSNTITNVNTHINISQLNSGMYFLKLTGEKESFVKQFIVK